MDSFAEKDEDDDEISLQKPMQAYNGAECIQLPELLLNDVNLLFIRFIR